MNHFRTSLVLILVAHLCAQTNESATATQAAFQAGRRSFQAGDYPEAVKQLAEAVRLSPDLPGLESLYGRALLNTGDPDGAAEAFQKALAADPKDFAANLGLAQVLVARRSFETALPLVRRALAAEPGSEQAKLTLAESLAGLHRFREARPYAEAASQTLATSPEAHQVLALVYSGLHRDADAAAERELAGALAPPDPGPALHQLAPDFSLTDTSSGKMVALSGFRGKSPVVLVFGSYSCPNFRSSADQLKSMYARYGSSVPFLLVYIREAHADASWQSTRNVRDGITLPPATTLSAKNDHAAMCSRTLHLPFPSVVDGMDNAVERAYNAWPSRAFIVGIDGRLMYSTRLTELDFHPDEMESVLREVVSSRSGGATK
jgi:tetratricopeptide (TPR) repeat protein